MTHTLVCQCERQLLKRTWHVRLVCQSELHPLELHCFHGAGQHLELCKLHSGLVPAVRRSYDDGLHQKLSDVHMYIKTYARNH